MWRCRIGPAHFASQVLFWAYKPLCSLPSPGSMIGTPPSSVPPLLVEKQRGPMQLQTGDESPPHLIFLLWFLTPLEGPAGGCLPMGKANTLSLHVKVCMCQSQP